MLNGPRIYLTGKSSAENRNEAGRRQLYERKSGPHADSCRADEIEENCDFRI